MTRDEIRAKVEGMIHKSFKHKKLPPLTAEMHLELDLGIDSLNRVELGANLLDLFVLEDIPIEEMVDLVTVGQVVEFIGQKLSK